MGTHRWGRLSVAAAGLVLGLAVTAQAAPPPAEELAEGKYVYLKPDRTNTPEVRRWAALAAAMPNWKQKAKASHYRFTPEKPGKKCDQKDCHPGFSDAFVAKLTALPEGPERQEARVVRHGEERCGDCHAPRKMVRAVVAHRLHVDVPERIGCSSCHEPDPKRLTTAGDARKIVVDGGDPRKAWPAHRLTQDKKGETCGRDCHVPDNGLAVENICGDCHGEGRLELAGLYDAGVLVHATDRASLVPSTTSGFFVVLTAGTLGFLFLYILFDIFRSRKEGQS